VSRQINVNDPDSWSDEDRLYLRDRLESVPPQHRHVLATPTASPPGEAETVEIARLRVFLENNYPEDMAAMDQGDTPVGVAIRLLTTDDTTDPDTLTSAGDDYDTWNVADLRVEADSRRRENPEANIPADVSKTKKADVIAILRDYDAKYPD